MGKKTFLKKLETKLEILDEKEQKKIIKKYESMIDKRVESGEIEEDVVKSFGTVDDLAKEILAAYNISKKYLEDGKNKKENSFEESFNSFISTVVNGVRDFVGKFESKDYHNLFEIILYVLLGLFILWVIRIPFAIFEAIGRGIFGIFDSPFNSALSITWVFIINVLYIVSVIWVIMAIFKNVSGNKTTTKIEKKELKTKKDEEVKEPIIKRDIERTYSNGVADVLSVILKVFIVMFTLPFIFAQIGLLVSLGVFIALLLTGAPVLGPLLSVLGLFLILVGTTDIIYRVTFKRRRND